MDAAAKGARERNEIRQMLVDNFESISVRGVVLPYELMTELIHPAWQLLSTGVAVKTAREC